MVSAGELVYGKRRALPAHPVHAHPSSRSSHKPSDVVRPTETRCRFCAGRMSSYEVGEAVAISKQAGRPGRAPYRPGRVIRVLPQPNASGLIRLLPILDSYSIRCGDVS